MIDIIKNAENIILHCEREKNKNHFAIAELFSQQEEKPDCPILEREIERLWFKQDTLNDRVKEAESVIEDFNSLKNT